jgi:type I site-specific restriction-modification system R (restriction) subunit
MRFNQALVISDGIEARIGSLTAGLDRFGPWRTIEGEARVRNMRSETASYDASPHSALSSPLTKSSLVDSV